MTRLERKEAELDKLYQYRAAAMKRNDIMWLQVNQKRISALEAEIAEMRKYEPKRLSELLVDRDESVKNEIYKSLLRISLLADVVNEAAERCRSVLKQYGLNDFHFRHKVVELSKISQEVAGIVIIPESGILLDFIVNDDEVVDKCVDIADKYLNDKLKI